MTEPFPRANALKRLAAALFGLTSLGWVIVGSEAWQWVMGGGGSVPFALGLGAAALVIAISSAIWFSEKRWPMLAALVLALGQVVASLCLQGGSVLEEPLYYVVFAIDAAVVVVVWLWLRRGRPWKLGSTKERLVPVLLFMASGVFGGLSTGLIVTSLLDKLIGVPELWMRVAPPAGGLGAVVAVPLFLSALKQARYRPAATAGLVATMVAHFAWSFLVTLEVSDKGVSEVVYMTVLAWVFSLPAAGWLTFPVGAFTSILLWKLYAEPQTQTQTQTHLQP